MNNADDEQLNDLKKKSTISGLILFSLPIIASNLVQNFGQIWELAIVGRYLGTEGLSAMNVCTIIYGLLTMTSLGFGFGGSIIAAQQKGAGDFHLLGRTCRIIFASSGICAAVIAVLGWAFRSILLAAVNTPQEVSSAAGAYMDIACIALIFYTFNTVISSILRGYGYSGVSMFLMLLQVLVNIGADYLSATGTEMGVKGIAVSMLISAVITFAAGLLIFIKIQSRLIKEHCVTAAGKNNVSSKTIFAEFLKISVPIIIFGILMSCSAMFINSNVNIYGIAASAADGIGNQIKNIVNGIFTGLYCGASLVVAGYYGQNNEDGIRSVVKRTLITGLCICAVIDALLNIFPETWFSLVSADASVISFAKEYFMIASLGYLGSALATGAFALIEGIGNTKLETISGIIENFAVKILLGYLFGKLWGLNGYWLGCACAAFVMPLVGAVYYKSRGWMKRKYFNASSGCKS